MKSANIKVAVRIRPLLEEEIRIGHTSNKLTIDQNTQSINAYNDRTSSYKNSTFDYVLDQDAKQRRVFDKAMIGDMIKQVTEGYHATIFAYGQTGSGKTYTMEGYRYRTNDKGIPIPIIEQGENEGLVPRSIYLLYDLIKKETSMQKKKFTVYCSYFQVYKEKIYDMLNKSHLKKLINDGPGLKLKWNKYDHFTVENLYTFECKSADDVLALYHFGIRNKIVASHNMNNASSRSHSVLSLTVESVDSHYPDNIVVSKLQLVDLAGSERQSLTGNVANKESIDINKSLFTLRQVITAITEKKQNQNQYIPYRESKLTSLLRQSLGGNSYCLMIACLNPCDAYIEENLNTLQYASKASYISNKPVRNEDPKNRMIEELKLQVKVLTEELAQANETIQFLSQLTGSSPETIKDNLKNVKMPQQLPGNSEQNSASSARTEKRDHSGSKQTVDRIIRDKDNIEKFFKEKSDVLSSIANVKNMNPNAANETKDAITERIIHTVNMMKEVLQSNLQLRETIQKQSEAIDDLNAELFQMQNENEDLRDRLQILEEFTGKDSMEEVSKLVKEKKVLENRVKHLEQTGMNWAQFQATRQQFHQHKEKINQSQIGGMIYKATLEDKFNDDYEPVRCAVDSGQMNGNANIIIERRNSHNGHAQKKKKKIQQVNYQKQMQRGKSTMPQYIMINAIPDQQSVSQDKHQDYKIRTVRSLAQAYQQQQQQQMSGKNNNTSRPPLYQFQGVHQQKAASQLNMTAYTWQNRNVSSSPFNGNHTQEMSYQNTEENDEELVTHSRSKSPMLQTQNLPNPRVNHNISYNILQRQHMQTADGPYKNNDSFQQESVNKHKVELPQPHITLRKREQAMINTQQRQAKSPNKFTPTVAYRQEIVSAKANSHHKKELNTSGNESTFSLGNNDEQDDEIQNLQYTEGDDEYEEDELNNEIDAYEVMVKQQLSKVGYDKNMKKRDNGFGYVDVSLPKIKNN